MSQADELLNSLTDEEIGLYTVNPELEEHIVIDDHRNITVPEPLKRIAVQFDHNVETVTFDCPRYWDEHDLSTMYIYVNYLRSDRNRGRCLAKNVRVDENDSNMIHFEWIIGNEITIVNGNLTFLVCALQTDSEGNEELHWNSEINNQMFVSTGLECTDVVIEEYPDIINDLLFRMDTLIAANTPTLDTSLTQSGFAADAKITGDALRTEATERQNADSAILNALNTETTARENGDNELNEALNTETTARQTADDELHNSLNAETASINATLNKKPYYFDNVATMKSSNLKSGDCAITSGYYSKNDGGNATYLIREKTSKDMIDDGFLHSINDTLVAELLIENNTINIHQLGARSQDKDNNKYDTKPYIDMYISYLNTIPNRVKLYIPAGIWYCSGVDLTRFYGFDIEGDEGFILSQGNGTVITSLNDNQDYVFNIGNNTTYTINFVLKNIVFSTADFKYNSSKNVFEVDYDNIKNINLQCLNFLYAEFGITDNLFFQHINGRAMKLSSSWEIYFKLLNFRDINALNSSILCFGSRDTTLQSTANITACNFEQVMFEQVLGDLIECEPSCRFGNCHFGLINFEDYTIRREGITYTAFNDEILNTFDEENVIHQSILRIPGSGEFKNIIDSIQLNNFSSRFSTYNNVNYVYDCVVYVTGDYSNINMIINNIDVMGMEKNARLLLSKGNVYQTSKFILNNVNNTSLKDFYFDINNFPYIKCDTRIKGINSTIKHYLLNNATPCYKLVNNRDTGLRFLISDNDVLNDLGIAVKQVSTAAAFGYIMNSTNLLIRAKVPNGETAKLAISGAHSQILTLEGTGEYKIYSFTMGGQFELGDIIHIAYESSNEASSCLIDYIIN